jgi:hypothetical protein
MSSAVTIAASLALAAGLAGTASAQPGMMDPEPPPPPQASAADHVDPDVAAALSVGGTMVSWGMILAASSMSGDSASTIGTAGVVGAMFGPSFGHWYAHSFATRGLGLRAAGAGAAFIGALVAFSECPLFSEEDCHESGLGPALAIAGAGLFIGGTLDDIATASRKARRYNESQLVQGVTVMPVLSHDAGGVAVLGRF